MILVKFWFWSFWFFWTQRDYVAGRFGAMGFAQSRHEFQQKGTKVTKNFPLVSFVCFCSHRHRAGWTRLKLRRGSGPALQTQKNETAGSTVLLAQIILAFSLSLQPFPGPWSLVAPARPMYFFSAVSTRMISPLAMNSGTMMERPVSSFASFHDEPKSPRLGGAVSTTLSGICCGRTMSRSRPSSRRALYPRSPSEIRGARRVVRC